MITVFIATFNRLSVLKRTVDSFARQTVPVRLVIVDNGTDHPLCLELLEELGGTHRVHSFEKVYSMEELSGSFLRAMWLEQSEDTNPWYAVTDADISFEQSHPQTLAKYIDLAEHTGMSAACHLRFDSGIPAGYPLRSRVLATESRIAFMSEMNWLNDIPYSACQVDTTFHLFPREKPFRRLKMDTLRVGYPYDAMHLDWYLDIDNSRIDEEIYMTPPGDPGVGSWGRGWLSDFWWTYQRSPEDAFKKIQNSGHQDGYDLCTTCFLLSWCYQYGKGVEKDPMMSHHYLMKAIPHPHNVYWKNEYAWIRMIYCNDFGGMGWT